MTAKPVLSLDQQALQQRPAEYRPSGATAERFRTQPCDARPPLGVKKLAVSRRDLGEAAQDLLGRVKEQRPRVLPKLLAPRRRRADGTPARPGSSVVERPREVGRRVPRELDDDAVQVLQMVGVAAADREQRSSVAALVAAVEGQQRGDVRV